MKFLIDNFSNIKENFEENLKKYTSIEEANQLMNQLASLNPSVFSDPEEAKLFLETNDVKYLKTFYTDTNQISGVGVDGNIIVNDKVLHEQIKAKLRTHAGIQETEVSDQPEVKPKTESELSNEAAADVEDTLGNMGINVVLDQPNNTPMLNALLKKEYRKYQATASIMGDPVISFDRWRDSQEGVNLQNGFGLLVKCPITLAHKK